MAIPTTDLDVGTRYALQEDFNNGFVGRDRQVVIQTDDPKGYRPVIMDGTTQGGKNKVALVDDLADYVPVADYNSDKAGFVTTSTLTSSLATKANTSHTHAQSDVTGLSDALAGKAAASHTHATSEVTGLDTALAAKADSSSLASLIPKTGARGKLAGYVQCNETSDAVTITADFDDDYITSGAVTVPAAATDGICWTKTVTLTNASPSVTLQDNWGWVCGSAPTLRQHGILVLAKRSGVGLANFVSPV